MTRSCSRARTERGYALIAAITLAVLYFALIELMLVDSSRELLEARQFRARVVAYALAENAAEIAATNIVNRMSTNASAEDADGTMHGHMSRNAGGAFQIDAEGDTKGLARQHATVRVLGRITGNQVHIDYTIHQP